MTENSKTESRLAQAQIATRELVEALEGGQTSTDVCLMKAQRVARLLRDGDAQRWLHLEATGYPVGFAFSSLGTCEGYATLGRVQEDGGYYTSSLPAIEAGLRAHERGIPEAAPLSVPIVDGGFARNATESLMQTQERSRLASVDRFVNHQQTYSAVKTGVHAYATQTLIALELGDAASDLFEAARGDVDVFVRAHCPQAAEQLTAMSQRLIEGGGEALASALTSCRRLLKSVADSVFPAQEEPHVGRDRKPREVGDEQYKNRLLAFLDQHLESESTHEITSSELEHLAGRLNAVYEKACKGVHDDVTIEEARLAVIHTYLFIAEVARIAQRTASEADS